MGSPMGDISAVGIWREVFAWTGSLQWTADPTHGPWKEKTGMHLRPWGVFWGYGGFSGFCVVNNTENPGKRTPKDLTFAELMRYNSFTFRNIVSHAELMYLAWCRPLRRTWMVSRVTAKQDDRIKRHFDFLFFPCILIAL